MSLINQKFNELRQKGKFALMPFLMAGDPTLDITYKVLLELQEKVSVGPLEVHLLLRQVTLSEKPVELSPREFALLCALLMPPGMVRSRQELLRMAWPPFSGGPRSVDTQVLTLRRKLEQAGLGEGGGITTVRQQGYRFSIDNL